MPGQNTIVVGKNELHELFKETRRHLKAGKAGQTMTKKDRNVLRRKLREVKATTHAELLAPADFGMKS